MNGKDTSDTVAETNLAAYIRVKQALFVGEVSVKTAAMFNAGGRIGDVRS